MAQPVHVLLARTLVSQQNENSALVAPTQLKRSDWCAVRALVAGGAAIRVAVGCGSLGLRLRSFRLQSKLWDLTKARRPKTLIPNSVRARSRAFFAKVRAGISLARRRRSVTALGWSSLRQQPAVSSVGECGRFSRSRAIGLVGNLDVRLRLGLGVRVRAARVVMFEHVTRGRSVFRRCATVVPWRYVARRGRVGTAMQLNIIGSSMRWAGIVERWPSMIADAAMRSFYTLQAVRSASGVCVRLVVLVRVES
jgi:hypothetical protein